MAANKFQSGIVFHVGKPLHGLTLKRARSMVIEDGGIRYKVQVPISVLFCSNFGRTVSALQSILCQNDLASG